MWFCCIIVMTNVEKPRKVQVGFQMTEPMNSEVNKIVKLSGYQDRAEFVRDAINEKIDRWKKESKT